MSGVLEHQLLTLAVHPAAKRFHSAELTALKQEGPEGPSCSGDDETADYAASISNSCCCCISPSPVDETEMAAAATPIGGHAEIKEN